MKKIYFACSIRGGRDDQSAYAEIAAIIKSHAHLLTEIFADGKLTPMGSPGKVGEIYKQDLGWIKEANAIIAEVTNPSLGVGYEIAKAEELNKPILCLYRPQTSKSLSAMIAGNPNLIVKNYEKISDTNKVIDEFVSSI